VTPANERKAKERQAKRDAGLVRVEVWVKPYHRASVQQHAERLKVWDKPRQLDQTTTKG
jgi:hypothetical protein